MAEIDEDMAWKTAGISLTLLGLKDTYRVPARKSH